MYSMQSKGPPSILPSILTDQGCGRVIPYNNTISHEQFTNSCLRAKFLTNSLT